MTTYQFTEQEINDLKNYLSYFKSNAATDSVGSVADVVLDFLNNKIDPDYQNVQEFKRAFYNLLEIYGMQVVDGIYVKPNDSDKKYKL